MIELHFMPQDTLSWEIRVKGRPVGFIAWRQTTDWYTRGHVAYEVAGEHQGKGYAKAALGALLDYIRARYPDHERVQICCAPDNVPSRRVIEANGGERDLSQGEIFQDPTDGKWTISYWVPVKKVVDTTEQKD